MSFTLGRRVPADFTHVSKYPLTAETAPSSSVPMAIGVNWYSNFDSPVKKGNAYYIGLDKNLGSIRGGHCVCIKNPSSSDLTSWWDFYNQGQEGACVGFGTSRMMSLLNRKRYDAHWLWDQAKLIDEWSDTNPGDDNGTSVRAALDVLRTRGHVNWTRAAKAADSDVAKRDALKPSAQDGIAANRWATSTDDVLKVTGFAGKDYVEFVNSWGRDYPHIVRMPAEVIDRLLKEDGEFGVVTDR
jgi:hypothetical protein